MLERLRLSWVGLALALCVMAVGCGKDKNDPAGMDGGTDGEVPDGSMDDGGTGEETIAEILQTVQAGAPESSLTHYQSVALKAHAKKYIDAYRAEWGTAGLAAKESTLLTAPTAEMTTNFDALIYNQFYGEVGDDFVASTSFTNADFLATMKKFYLARVAGFGSLLYDFFYMDIKDWDGVTTLSRHPVSDSQSIDAVKTYATDLLAELKAYDAGDLTATELAVREKALYYTRQLASGTTGYYALGGDDLKTATGVGYLAYNLMFEHASEDNGGLALNPDVNDFYEQVNALYWASEKKWTDKGVVYALADSFYFSADPETIQFFLGNGEEAKIYTLLTTWFMEGVADSADGEKACTIYSEAEQDAIWEAFSADLIFNANGEGSLAGFADTFDGYADAQTDDYKENLKAALQDFGNRNVKNVAAAIIAVDADTKLATMLNTATTTLSVGDAMDFQDEFDGITKIGGYEDETAAVTVEDDTKVQAMWDRYKAYVVTTYGFDAELLPDDVNVVNDFGSSTDPNGDITIGIAEAASLGQIYATFIHEGTHAANYLAGQFVEGPAWEGAGLLAQHTLITDVLDAMLPMEGAGETDNKWYYLLTAGSDARYLATTEATIKRHLRTSCDGLEPDTIDFAYGIAEEWGITDIDLKDAVAVRSHEGTSYLAYSAGEILYAGILAAINTGWDHTVDTYQLIGCEMPNPDVSVAGLAATRVALASCIDP